MISREGLRKNSPLLLIFLLILLVWRTFTLLNPPNLLNNADFALSDLSGWEIIGDQNQIAVTVDSTGGSKKLILTIPDSPEGSLIGIGQRLNLPDNQPYELTIQYRLPNEPGQSNFVVQVNYFGEQDSLLKQDEVGLPVATSRTTPAGWFEDMIAIAAEPDVSSIQVGLGLFGVEATSVEVQQLYVGKVSSIPHLWQDFWVIGLGVLIIGVLCFWLLAGRKVVTSQQKQGRRLLPLVVVNLVLLVVFAEIGAVMLYFAQTGALYYTNRPSYELIDDTETSEEVLTAKRIHPFFGYVDQPGWDRSEDNFWNDQDLALRRINNHGLGSAYDYPFVKTNENQFIIGVFGGSVAEQFAIFTEDKIVAEFKKNEFFADKELVILNFAKGGYKQPQQVIILTYFLSLGQTFDLVINLDGFNEVTFSHRNDQRQVDLSMPSTDIMDGLLNLTDQNTLTPEKLTVLAEINQHKTTLNQVAHRINRAQFAVVGVGLGYYYNIAFHNHQAALVKFNESASHLSDTSLLFLKQREQSLDDDRLFGQIADSWVKSSVIMHQILENEGVPYFHVLQPNQHFTNKKFTPEEQDQALEVNPFYSTLVLLGYPRLVEKSKQIVDQNVNFYDAISLYDDEARQVYIDNCCHINQLGNELLADFIVASILESGEFSDD